MVQAALKSFCDELIHRIPESIEPILLGRRNVVGRQDLKQDPEQLVNQYLVWPICDSINLEYISEWYYDGYDGSIDFYIQNTYQPVFGECKRINHYTRAISDLREYLNHRTAPTQFGIATDGINWLYLYEPGDMRKNVEILEYHSFRGAIFDYFISADAIHPELQGKRVLWNSSVGKVAKAPYDQYGKLHRVPIEESIRRFTEKFSPDNLSAYSGRHEYDKPMPAFDDRSPQNNSDMSLNDFK